MLFYFTFITLGADGQIVEIYYHTIGLSACRTNYIQGQKHQLES